MNQELHEDETGEPLAVGPEAEPGGAAEVAFAIPPEPYESVVTESVESPPMITTTESAGPAGLELGREAVESVRALGERLDRRFDELKSLFEREIRAESTREKVVDRLHAELQEYKQDLLLNTLRPVFIDLIQLHDDIGKVAVANPAGDATEENAEVRRLVALMEGFQQGIEDILYRQGVEPFRVEGDTFDPRQQRAVMTAPTDDPALNKTVAARLRKGFRSGDRLIRPEIVSVYAFKR